MQQNSVRSCCYWGNITRNECASGWRPATISKHHQPRCASLDSRDVLPRHFPPSVRSLALARTQTHLIYGCHRLLGRAHSHLLKCTHTHRHTCLPHDMIGEGQTCSYNMPRSMMHNRTALAHTPVRRECATFLRGAKWNGI